MIKIAHKNSGKFYNNYLLVILVQLFIGYSIDVQAETPWPWNTAIDESSVTLLLLGDFNVQKRAAPADALILVRETLNQADVVYANLEGLLVESKGPDQDLPNKSGWTHLGPEAAQALHAGNIVVVGVANNVAYGRENIMASLSVLDANGIVHAGAGKNIEQAHLPAIVEKKGVRFGFLQYTSKWNDEAEQMATATSAGVARLKSADGVTIDPADLERMLDDIQRTRPLVDILIVSAHTRDGQSSNNPSQRSSTGNPPGRDSTDLYSLLPVNENLQYVEPYQIQFARTAIDAGADIVFGHGCHMLQAVEIYRDKPVMHCLGNFASDWIRVRNYRDGMVARIVVKDKQLQRASLVPVARDHDSNNVRLLAPDSIDGSRLYQKITDLSSTTTLSVAGQELILLDKE